VVDAEEDAMADASRLEERRDDRLAEGRAGEGPADLAGAAAAVEPPERDRAPLR
jgi:hypothetical protein